MFLVREGHPEFEIDFRGDAGGDSTEGRDLDVGGAAASGNFEFTGGDFFGGSDGDAGEFRRGELLAAGLSEKRQGEEEGDEAAGGHAENFLTS